MTDNLTAEFGLFQANEVDVDTAGEYTVANIASATLTENANFNGAGDQNMLAGTDTLAIGATATITFDLIFVPNFANVPFENSVEASGVGAVSGATTTDTSQDGTDPDPNGDNSPAESQPTVITVPRIDAVDDDFSGTPIPGDGGGNTPTVFTNDTLNGAPFTPTDVTPTITNDGGLTGVRHQSRWHHHRSARHTARDLHGDVSDLRRVVPDQL